MDIYLKTAIHSILNNIVMNKTTLFIIIAAEARDGGIVAMRKTFWYSP